MICRGGGCCRAAGSEHPALPREPIPQCCNSSPRHPAAAAGPLETPLETSTGLCFPNGLGPSRSRATSRGRGQGLRLLGLLPPGPALAAVTTWGFNRGFAERAWFCPEGFAALASCKRQVLLVGSLHTGTSLNTLARE